MLTSYHVRVARLTLLGALVGFSAQAAEPYGYTGREADASGLIYYRSRYYDPTNGRFLQRDHIGLAGGVNDYAYVGGNPVSWVDPRGREPRPGTPTYVQATRQPQLPPLPPGLTPQEYSERVVAATDAARSHAPGLPELPADATEPSVLAAATIAACRSAGTFNAYYNLSSLQEYDRDNPHLRFQADVALQVHNAMSTQNISYFAYLRTRFPQWQGKINNIMQGFEPPESPGEPAKFRLSCPMC